LVTQILSQLRPQKTREAPTAYLVVRKWAPVRTYYGQMGNNGERGSRWRLMVRLLTRNGVEEREAMKSQPFSLIVTIADPEKRAPVYDEMARIVRNRFQSQNLAVRTTARIRGRT